MSRNRRSGSSGGGANKGGNRKSKAPAQGSSRDFWGTRLPVPDDRPSIAPAPDPTAVFRSLGPPPLAGHAAIAENYFTLVYDRAAGLATALAASSGLLETDDV